MERRFIGWLIGIIGIQLLTGCIGSRYLQKNEKILYKQTIRAPKGFDKAGLATLFAQKPNRKMLGAPLSPWVYLYQWGKNNYDRTALQEKKIRNDSLYDIKIANAPTEKKKTKYQFAKKKKADKLTDKIENGNKRMQWGDSLAVFDSTLTDKTIQNFKAYLSSVGYPKNNVKVNVMPLGNHSVRVRYEITPGTPLKMDTILYAIPDTALARVIRQEESPFIHANMLYNEDTFEKERERIETLMKNNGFYSFTRQYISFGVDTAYSQKIKTALQVEIDNPTSQASHFQMHLDSVWVATDAGIRFIGKNMVRQTKPYHDIQFQYYKKRYNLRILAERIYIKPNQLYSREQTIRTQQHLASLDIFKFVNINYDTTGHKNVAHIFTSPLSTYGLTHEVGMTVTQGYPGPYYNANFKKRNLFGGLEIFEINGRYGFEGVAPATSDVNKVLRNKELSGNMSVSFPQFLFPFSRTIHERLAQYNPRTKVTAAYTFTDRPEYKRQIITLNGTYSWEVSGKSQFAFTPLSISIIKSPFIREDFSDILKTLAQQGNNLIRAFNTSLVSSMLFTFTRSKNLGSKSEHATFFRSTIESGGTFLDKKLYFPFYTTEKIRNAGYEPYQFLRISLDFRQNKVINNNTSVAYRINSGVGYVFSSNGILPYEKNFFIGGSNSVRAWRPRRLGQGELPPAVSSNPTRNGYFDYSFEKPGNVLLEGSIEYRQKLVGFINYAFFVDAGNVWSLQLDSDPLAKFDVKQFYKQFGVGTGLGLRFDFTFLILRIDCGIKAWDPARPRGEQFVLPNARLFRPFNTTREPVLWNLGIGYPF